MADVAFIDVETRSVLDLKESGTYNYFRHPTTDIWCLSYAFNNEEPQIWTPDDEGEGFKAFWNWCDQARFHEGHRIIAHNAAFEMMAWEHILGPRYGFPALDHDSLWVCTMVRSYAMGLPGALEDAGMALGLHIHKDVEGRSLMLRMAKPRKIVNGKPIWWDEPDKLKRLYEYCKQDVRVEREVYGRTLGLSKYESDIWRLDQEINRRGFRIDRPVVRAAVDMVDALKLKSETEIARLTDGRVETANALIPMKQWMGDLGVKVTALDKQAVTDLLTGELPGNVRKVLQLRQDIGKSSTAKLDKMLTLPGADDRIRFAFQYWGAAPGRWSGRGVQPHNFPRDVPSQEEVADIFNLIKGKQYDLLDILYGSPLGIVSKCLRGFIVPESGNLFAVGDFANVEGRGVAWLSGEQWKLDAFRKADVGSGPGIYELAYAKSFGVPVGSVKNPSPERQTGKVQELALGYQGGVGALRRMLPPEMRHITDKELDNWKHAWRKIHLQTGKTWYALQDAAIAAVANPGQKFTAGADGRQVVYKMAGSFLWCRLPSGRAMCYPYPKLLEGARGPELTYTALIGEDNKTKRVDDPQNTATWARVKTYGGSLMQNIMEGVCRDLLVHAMQRVDEFVVLHVHDEIVCEASTNEITAVAGALEFAMNTPPAWAKDFPLHAKIKVMDRYGK